MNPADEVLALVAKFVEEMTELAKREALRHVSLAFGVHDPSPASTAASRNGTRPAAELDSLKQRILAHVASYPGVRTEQLKAALGTRTKELTLPLRQLVAAGTLKTEGERRGTKYYAASQAKKTPRPARRWPARA